jgi:hypothetical protein
VLDTFFADDNQALAKEPASKPIMPTSGTEERRISRLPFPDVKFAPHPSQITALSKSFIATGQLGNCVPPMKFIGLPLAARFASRVYRKWAWHSPDLQALYLPALLGRVQIPHKPGTAEIHF